MKCTILATVALALTANAAVIRKRADNPTDEQILQYALTLEHLENAFYKEALEKFDAKAFEGDGFPSWTRDRIQQIADHEANHVAFLSKALGDSATKPCTYEFNYKTPHDFTALSAVIEGVGVSAYLGAAKFITNPDYLTAAGSILTTESRHQAWINSAANKDTPWSGAYDAPLSLNEVYSLAAGFIKSCPDSNPKLPVKAFPALAVTSKNPTAGKKATFAFDSDAKGLKVAFIGSTGTQFATLSGKTATIPKGLEGTVYAVLTSASKAPVTDDTIVAGPAIFTFGLPSDARQQA